MIPGALDHRLTREDIGLILLLIDRRIEQVKLLCYNYPKGRYAAELEQLYVLRDKLAK